MRISEDIKTLLQCPYCNGNTLEISETKATCLKCSTIFPEKGGGLDLITSEAKKSLEELVKLNFEDRPGSGLSSDNKQHSKESYAKSDYLPRLKEELDLPDGSYILDAGCGRGHISEYLASNGLRVLSTDVVLENIQDNENPNKIFASIDNLPIKDNSLDAIISTDVLEHIYPETQESVLNEFFRTLKPGGKLLISYPGNRIPAHSGHYVIDFVYFLLNKFTSYNFSYIGRGYGGAAHINMRLPWKITKAFKKAGFEGKVKPQLHTFMSLPKKLIPVAKLLNLPIINIFFVAQMTGLITKPKNTKS